MKEFTQKDYEALAAAVKPLGYEVDGANIKKDSPKNGGGIYALHLVLVPVTLDGESRVP